MSLTERVKMDSSDSSNERSPKKACLNDESDTTETFTPREYQVELLLRARERNIIACLGTGTGKTFIAVLLIREMAEKVRIPYEMGGKRILFFVPTVPLVHQQEDVIKKHVDLKVKGYVGAMGVDTWEKETWEKEFLDYQVLVMTAEIGRIILNHGFIRISQLQLLIFDECHRAVKGHPYREIMRCFDTCNSNEFPKVLGLSASILNGKCTSAQLEKRISDLEMTLMSSATTPADIKYVENYGTSPNQYLVFCHSYKSKLPEINSINLILSEASTVLKEKKFELASGDDIKFLAKPKRCISIIERVICNLGPWCSIKAAEIFKKEIESLIERPNRTESVPNLEYALKVFKRILIELKKYVSDEFSVFLDMPHKFERLLDILLKVHCSLNSHKRGNAHLDSEDGDSPLRGSCETSTSDNLCAIIFVKERITAYCLYHWLLEVSRQSSKYEFIKPYFVVGHGAQDTEDFNMSLKQQKAAIHKFRNKECNVITATSVFEEGMDIPKCNLVLRFDLPQDFRSYIQSRGRARASPSSYVLLATDEDKNKILEDIHNFIYIEKMLSKYCINRDELEEEDIKEHMNSDLLLPPYMPVKEDGAPRITLKSAICVVNRYCAKLPCDMTTRLRPNCEIIPNEETKPISYQCSITLPKNSKLKVKIKGEFMRSKKLAKAAAALKVCEMLHKLNELNENLVPYGTSTEFISNDKLFSVELENAKEDKHSHTCGSKLHRKTYKRQVADALSGNFPVVNEPSYLYMIEMKLTEPVSSAENPKNRRVCDPADTTLGLGILCSNKIPQIPGFPVYTRSGTLMINLKMISSDKILSEYEVEELSFFHCFIFKEVLFLVRDVFNFNPKESESSYLIVPVNKNGDNIFDIDWKFISTVKNWKQPSEKESEFMFCEDDYSDAVVMRNYYMHKGEKMHYVDKICYDKNPCTEMEPGITFKDHFILTYKIKITDDNQPLLDVHPSCKLNLAKPCFPVKKKTAGIEILSKHREKRLQTRHYFIPELCIIQSFPSLLWRKTVCIPTIMYRINALLLSEQIRVRLATEAYIGMANLPCYFVWPQTNFANPQVALCPTEIFSTEGSSINESIENCSNDTDKTQSIPCPSPDLIYKALTTRSANDLMNLERLETLGDCFLKYLVSVMLYCKFHDLNEGELTMLRVRMVSNRTLYNLAIKKGLEKYMFAIPFDASFWLPPCYTIMKPDDPMNGCENFQDLKELYTVQEIPGKSVADCMEALIGAYLLSCGQYGASHFMSWLGMKILPGGLNSIENTSTSANCTWSPPREFNYIIDEANFQKNWSGLSDFENIIKYNFKDKRYLVQAFTHASYILNDVTDCYQRLEFLGDAILDYLVTCHVFDKRNYSPGQLSDLKCALVNNTSFAFLAVKYNYNRFLKHMSPALLSMINEFISMLEKCAEFEHFQESGFYLEEDECEALDEVEVPKALGDVFESVAGAIFLDSGMSLDTVWKVYYAMMKPSIEHVIRHIPKHPVRVLHEKDPDTKFFKPSERSSGRIEVTVKLGDGRTFTGVGASKIVAKKSAAKRALKALKLDSMNN